MARSSLQAFGFKSKGLVSGLFVMGLVLHFLHVQDPLGDAIMVLAVVFAVVFIIVGLEKNSRRIKRRI